MRRRNRPEQATAATPAPVAAKVEELDPVADRERALTMAANHRLELVDLREVTPEPAATELLDEATARALVAIPLHVGDGAVVVAVADPATEVLDGLREALGHPIQVRVAPRSDVL